VYDQLESVVIRQTLIVGQKIYALPLGCFVAFNASCLMSLTEGASLLLRPGLTCL
jgi:hypothetical protein